jgi:glycogen debranching enzyme
MADLENKIGNKNDAKKYQELARKCKKAFNEKFYNKKRKCLYDVIGDAKIRPNQLFSMSLTYQVIDTNSEEAKANETSIKDADGKRIELEDD